jgi:hypothetical protein
LDTWIFVLSLLSEFFDLKGRIFVEDDEMRFGKKTLIGFNLFAVFILINLFLACSGVMPLSRGAWVEEKNRIPVLHDGQQEGSWQTRDLSISYELRKEGNTLRISGVVDFGGHITRNFSTLEYLTIYIHALKDNGIVLQTKPVKTFGYRRQFDLLGKLSFKGHFDMAADADILAVAFSYHGTAREQGGAISWEFWKIPRRKPPE